MTKLRGLRWWIMGLIAVATVINYIDRTSLAVMWPDISKELENWEQLIKKSIKSLYLPSMSKKLRETIIRVEFIQKAMTTSLYAGIILITFVFRFQFFAN
jgi:hypothetical protein